jgi:hypothetical protein
MAGITGYFAAITTPLLLAVTAAAQTLPLEAVEQRVTDISELDLSLRQVQTGLLQPNNFKELYRSPVDDRFARIQGGLYAVFPRSVYAAKKDKQKRIVVYPVVPAGTIFYIGPPPGWTLSTALDEVASRQEPNPARIEGRLDLRITPGLMGAALTAGPQAQQQEHRYSGNNTQPATVPRMVLDPEYRAQRVRSLMDDAAQASRPHIAR